MTVDLANSDQLLTTTRAVRKRLDFDIPVGRSLIEQSVEVALQAPSGSDLYPVDFVVVTDPERRKLMGEIYCEAYFPYLDEIQPHFIAKLTGEAAAQFTRHIDMVRWHAENVHRAPVHVRVGGKGRYEKLDVFEQATFYGCILPPAWSFMLALRARGIGSSWTTIHLKDPYEERMRELLELPKDYTLGVFLPCGYYKGKDFKSAQRPALSEVLHWDKW